MKINTRARYALRMMADISKYENGSPVPLKDVAERQGLSKRYLDQLSIALRNASLLKSVQGMRGGFQLARPASEIRIIEIIEAADGPVDILGCISDDSFCERSEFCPSRTIWDTINGNIVDTLSKHTLEDLVCNSKKKSKAK